MPKKQPNLDALGADYREAKASIPAHLERQKAIELERTAWLKKRRGVPADVLYDRETGEPRDPTLVDIESRLATAEGDVRWCRGLVIACGEAYKGETFQAILDRNEQNRAKVEQAKAQATGKQDD